jgi:hypothetical protein
MGLFAARTWIYPLNNGRSFPLSSSTHVTWVVIAPQQGIEIQSSLSAQQLVTFLSADPRATLVEAQAGVYVFRVTLPPSDATVTLQRGPKLAWVDPGPGGTAIALGTEDQWYLASNGVAGYVMAYDYFRETAGDYRAVVRLDTTSPLNVEVWDDSTNTMLARDTLSATARPEQVSVPFTLSHAVGDHPFAGSFLWVIHPTPGPPGDQLEVRAYSATGAGTKIYSVAIEKSRPLS